MISTDVLKQIVGEWIDDAVRDRDDSGRIRGPIEIADALSQVPQRLETCLRLIPMIGMREHYRGWDDNAILNLKTAVAVCCERKRCLGHEINEVESDVCTEFFGPDLDYF